MTARTPQIAAQEFFEPLQQALGCVARAKITTSPGGRTAPDESHSWTINDGSGLQLGELTLHTAMRYRIMRGVGGYRVTTEAYKYAFNAGQQEIIAWHWHPGGNSRFVLPHIHVGAAALADTGVFTPRAHIRSARTAFEEVIGKGIDEFGITAIQDDWRDRINGCMELFEANRTWRETPEDRLLLPWTDQGHRGG